MLKQSASGVFEARGSYLVKRRSFPDSSGRFTFHVSRFTNDKPGIFERPAVVHRWVLA
jgi:hypothetical protein